MAFSIKTEPRSVSAMAAVGSAARSSAESKIAFMVVFVSVDQSFRLWGGLPLASMRRLCPNQGSDIVAAASPAYRAMLEDKWPSTSV